MPTTTAPADTAPIDVTRHPAVTEAHEKARVARAEVKRLAREVDAAESELDAARAAADRMALQVEHGRASRSDLDAANDAVDAARREVEDLQETLRQRGAVAEGLQAEMPVAYQVAARTATEAATEKIRALTPEYIAAVRKAAALAGELAEVYRAVRAANTDLRVHTDAHVTVPHPSPVRPHRGLDAWERRLAQFGYGEDA